MVIQINKWEIWSAEYRYEDDPSVTKRRPVLVIDDNCVFPILIAKITSSPPREGYFGEYPIKFWREAGLQKESTVRLSKVLNAEERDLKCKIGRLHPYDIMQIERIMLD